MDRKRLIHQLDTPYSTIQWPQIQPDDQDAILELLCNFLTPLGAYRQSYTSPSKGKRQKAREKQKRKKASSPPRNSDKPPPPALGRFVDVGLASVSRGLQEAASSKASSAARQGTDPGAGAAAPMEETPPVNPVARPSPYAAVFVARHGQTSAFHCHFPQMTAVASECGPDEAAVRLVGFNSATCEARLSECLGFPRVSCVAVRAGAPLSSALIDFVREKVAPVNVSWLKEVEEGYQETKINTIQTTVGPKKQRCS